MRERSFLKGLCCSIASLASVTVLAVIVAQNPAAATDTAVPAAPVAAVAGEKEEHAHEAPRTPPVRRSPTVVAAVPQLLPAVDQPDIRPGHRLLADRVIRSLPSGCSSQLQNFYVRYDNPSQRGLGGKSTIIVAGEEPDGDPMPEPELAALIMHECAHLAHGSLMGNPASGASAFRDGQQPFYNDSPFVQYAQISWETERVMRRGVTAQGFCSGYGKTDVFEDFSECFAAYITQYDWMRQRAADNAVIAAKLAWMETYFPTPLHGVIDGQAEWNGNVPWDITKLPYAWPVLEVAKAA